MTDPTDTDNFRDDYVIDLTERFEKLKGFVERAIVKHDAFDMNAMVPRKLTGNERDKAQGFMEACRKAVDSIILEVRARRGPQVVNRNAWQNSYVRKATMLALRQARERLSQAGFDPRDEPIDVALQEASHYETLRKQQMKHFTELRGVTDSMLQEIARQVLTGLHANDSKQELVSAVNTVIDSYLKQDARNLAHAEVIRTHAESLLVEYRKHDIDQVKYVAPDNTSSDASASYDGTIVTLNEAVGKLPLHPRSHGTWSPLS